MVGVYYYHLLFLSQKCVFGVEIIKEKTSERPRKTVQSV